MPGRTMTPPLEEAERQETITRVEDALSDLADLEGEGRTAEDAMHNTVLAVVALLREIARENGLNQRITRVVLLTAFTEAMQDDGD